MIDEQSKRIKEKGEKPYIDMLHLMPKHYILIRISILLR